MSPHTSEDSVPPGELAFWHPTSCSVCRGKRFFEDGWYLWDGVGPSGSVSGMGYRVRCAECGAEYAANMRKQLRPTDEDWRRERWRSRVHDDTQNHAVALAHRARRAPDRRISRLAVAAIPAALLCCPCLLSALLEPVRDHLPRALMEAGVFSWLRRWGVITLMLGATAVPVAAVMRVWSSRGTRSGMGLAVAGLSLSLLWWLLLLVVRMGFRGWAVAA